MIFPFKTVVVAALEVGTPSLDASLLILFGDTGAL